MSTEKKATVAITGTVLTWKWAHGDSTTVDANDLPADIQIHGMVHGLKQKLSDEYSGIKSSHVAQDAMEALWDSLMEGTWNKGRSSTGGIWVEAIAKATGETLEAVLEVWNAKDADERKELQKHPAIKAAKAEIELERAKAKAKGTELDLSEI
jgi:hypothetical protein